MVDFKAAFDKGQAAYEKSRSEKQEIDGTLRTFSQQIHEFTDGQLEIRTEKQTRREPVRGLFGLPGEEKVTTYTALIACLTSTGKTAELSRFEIAREGYPVTIDIGGRMLNCHDKASLEQGLASLLQDPVNAGKLRDLLNSARNAAPSQEQA